MIGNNNSDASTKSPLNADATSRLFGLYDVQYFKFDNVGFKDQGKKTYRQTTVLAWVNIPLHKLIKHGIYTADRSRPQTLTNPNDFLPNAKSYHSFWLRCRDSLSAVLACADKFPSEDELLHLPHDYEFELHEVSCCELVPCCAYIISNNNCFN